MKKNYKVSFRWYDTDTFCTNICAAENEDAVREHYSKYRDVSVSPVSDGEVRTAKMKGMPFTEA